MLLGDMAKQLGMSSTVSQPIRDRRQAVNETFVEKVIRFSRSERRRECPKRLRRSAGKSLAITADSVTIDLRAISARDRELASNFAVEASTRLKPDNRTRTTA